MALLRHKQISILFIIVLLFIANVANVNAQASGNVGPPSQPTDSPQPQPQSEPPSQPTTPPQQPSASPKQAPSSPAQQQKSKVIITATNNVPAAITITSTSIIDTPTSKTNVNSANSNDSSGSTGSIITAAIVV
ncbi:1554_t:CDS:2, partial [Racocetra persica]